MFWSISEQIKCIDVLFEKWSSGSWISSMSCLLSVRVVKTTVQCETWQFGSVGDDTLASLLGHSHLVGLLDVAGEADAVDPEDELDDSEADYGDEHIVHSFCIINITVSHTISILGTQRSHLAGNWLHDDDGNQVDESDDKQCLVQTSLVQAGSYECANWSDDNVEHDDKASHVLGDLGSLHHASIGLLKKVVANAALILDRGPFIRDHGLLDVSLDLFLEWLWHLILLVKIIKMINKTNSQLKNNQKYWFDIFLISCF